MTEKKLNEILEEICSEEVSEYEKVKPRNHFFSFRHRNAMEEILYPHRCSEEVPDKRKKLPVHKRLLILTIVIFMAVISIAAGGVMQRGFNREVDGALTMLFTADANNCPETIEDVYYLPEIPKGLELYEEHYSKYHVTIFYENIKTKRDLTFAQDVKARYKGYFYDEKNTFEEVSINGNYGLFKYNDAFRTLVWDNGDYILYLSGSYTKEELIKLAESVKIKDGGIENDRNNAQ